VKVPLNLKLFCLAFFSFAIVLLCLWLGPACIFPSNDSQALRPDLASELFWKIRFPRVMLAFVVGAGLALGGACFQTTFGNPLATPYTLGVASGASLGAVLALRFVGFGAGNQASVSISSMIGALSTVALVLFIARRCKAMESSSMLLAGVAISLFFSSLILFIQYISDFTQSFVSLRWLMGSLDTVGYSSLAYTTPVVLISSAVIFSLRHELDVIATGNDLALSRGVEVSSVKTAIFIFVSLIVGSVVSVAGPIGFVGIIVPHLARAFVGSLHSAIIPSAILLGGTLLVFCDTLGRVIVAPAEIPVGVIMALVGGPCFLFVLVYRVSRQE